MGQGDTSPRKLGTGSNTGAERADPGNVDPTTNDLSNSRPDNNGPGSAGSSSSGPSSPPDAGPGTAPTDTPASAAAVLQPPGPPEALSELVSLLLASPDVEQFLQQIAIIAARTTSVLLPSDTTVTLPPQGPAGDALATGGGESGTWSRGAVSCGITLSRASHPLTVASSDALATAVDEAQYATDVGPCLEALDTGRVISCPDLAGEHRWPAYTARAMTYGIASSLSLPLAVNGAVLGALNLYARTPHAFDDPERAARAQVVAEQASATLALVLRQVRQADVTASLRATLASRSLIDQAIGILMGQQRCTAVDAFALLRTASQHRNRKLREVAADVVTSASGHPPQASRYSDPA